MSRITVPVTSALPSSVRVNTSHPIVQKLLGRLSRPSLLSLALDWLKEGNVALSSPYLRAGSEPADELDEDDMFPPARSLKELQESYLDLQARKGSKREILDRIIDGDWRWGLSLYQLGMADLQYLYDHPNSQKWTALRIVPLRTTSGRDDDEEAMKVDKESLVVPRFHPSTFVQRLKAQILPDVKAHFTLDQHRHLPIILLRIFIVDSPYNTDLAAMPARGEGNGPTSFDSSRTIFLAFPDASPHIYISRAQVNGPSTSGESKSLSRLTIEGIPKALSQPHQRFTLKNTGLITRNLSELLEKRGAGRTNFAGGGWSIYADDKKKESPLDTTLPTPPLSDASIAPSGDSSEGPTRKRALSPGTELDLRNAKRARLVAQARFGDSGKVDDGKGVERVDIVLEDSFPKNSLVARRPPAEMEEEEPEPVIRSRRSTRRSELDRSLVEAAEEEDAGGSTLRQEEEPPDSWRPMVRFTFQGPQVFAGIRQLVEQGIIDGERMPGWMTGEEGVTVGAVRHGRIRGYKGSGI